MKTFKILLLTCVLALLCSSVEAQMNIGTYHADTEYGLIDGFKFNILNRKEGQKIIEIRSETPEEKERLEKEKNKPKEVQDEYELFHFLQNNVVPY